MKLGKIWPQILANTLSDTPRHLIFLKIFTRAFGSPAGRLAALDQPLGPGTNPFGHDCWRLLGSL